jgi:signal transduction histidine kinase
VRRRSPSWLTIRVRLTLVYGGLFLIAGVLLLAVTYALMAQQLPGGGGFAVSNVEPSGQPAAAASVPAAVQERNAYPPNSTDSPGDFARQARSNALRALLTQGGIALGAVGVIAVGLGWLIAGRLLQPLQRMTETARRIANAPAADRSLHERIGLTGPPDEIQKLAETFDLMLERLDRSFDGQRRFIGNASHELRTPVTLSRTLLEVGLAPPELSPQFAQLRRTLLAVNARQERLIDGLLLLARSEREVADRSFVDLADIVEHVASQVPAGAVAVTVTAGEAATTGNPVLLERLVQNLVENGIRHNLAADGWVRVRTGTEPGGPLAPAGRSGGGAAGGAGRSGGGAAGGAGRSGGGAAGGAGPGGGGGGAPGAGDPAVTAVLEVSNTGPVVPAYDVPSLFEPFRRLGGDRPGAPAGAGLGLSIVQAVARAHGGEVRARPREGGGLVVRVTLPGCAAVEIDGDQ